MSNYALTAVWRHSQAEGSTRLVALALADSAHNETGETWVGVGTIAAMCHVGRRTVQRSIDELEGMGEWSRVIGGGRSYGGGPTNLYRVNLPGATHSPVDKSPNTAPPHRGITAPSATHSAPKTGVKGCHPDRPNHKEPIEPGALRGYVPVDNPPAPAYEHPDVVPAAEVPARVAALRAGLTRRPTRRPPAPREPAITAVPPDPPTLEVLEGDADGEGLA